MRRLILAAFCLLSSSLACDQKEAEIEPTQAAESSTAIMDQTEAPELRACLIQIHYTIDSKVEEALKTQISRAIESGIKLIIFELVKDTGGYLRPTVNLARYITGLDENKIRTIAFIPREAVEGAAILAMSCDEIFMNPKAIFGDARSIEVLEGRNGRFEIAPEKWLERTKKILVEFSHKKNRPEAVLKAMVDKNLRVHQVRNQRSGLMWFMSEAELDKIKQNWTKIRVVPESIDGTFLKVNGKRAVELKIANGVVEDLDELKRRLGIDSIEKQPS